MSAEEIKPDQDEVEPIDGEQPDVETPARAAGLADLLSGVRLTINLIYEEFKRKRSEGEEPGEQIDVGGRPFRLCDVGDMTGYQLAYLYEVYEKHEHIVEQLAAEGRDLGLRRRKNFTLGDFQKIIRLLVRHGLMWDLLALIYVPLDENGRARRELETEELFGNAQLMRSLTTTQILEGVTLFFVSSGSSIPAAIHEFCHDIFAALTRK